MKICLVGPTYPYRGGISHFTQMLAREFMTSHEVRVVGFSRLYPSFLFPGRTQFDQGGELVHVDAVREIDSINPWSWRRAAHAVARFGPGLVVFQWWQPFFAPAFRFIAARARKRGARVVFLCHNVLPHEPKRFDRMLTRWGLGASDGFVVQSREDAAVLRSILPEARVEFNPMPIFDLFRDGDLGRADARRRLGVDGNVILFFGLVRAYKGLATLLDAFALCAERLDATLLVVGEFYESRGPYDDRIRALGIGHRVRIVDRYVSNEEVPVYFKAADVAVLPYVTATQSAVVQTAYAFAIPVIVTAVGGLPDVVDDGRTGFVVPPNSPGQLAEAIGRFYDEHVAERMSAAIRADRGVFSWRSCTDAIFRAAGAGAGAGEDNR
jgi:glycosyltransferase involved in cell wall biosynthesis